jgi:hypothetical protein
MHDETQLKLLKVRGVEAWNQWRYEHPSVCPNFHEANLYGCDLAGANLRSAILFKADRSSAHLSGADLTEAELGGAILLNATLTGANLTRAGLNRAILRSANLTGAILAAANLREAELSGADLSGADLRGADLCKATLVGTNLNDADLSGARTFGISAWNVDLTGVKQNALVITDDGEPAVTVDNVEVAQFIYLLLRNPKIRDVLDTVARKVVMILGRFAPEQKAVLDRIRDDLRRDGHYVPVIFDFPASPERDFTETVTTLARLSRFVIADLTNFSSVPHEFASFVKEMAIPVQPVLHESSTAWSMFGDYWKYDWVFEPYVYATDEDLLQSLRSELLGEIEAMREDLAARRARRLPVRRRRDASGP